MIGKVHERFSGPPPVEDEDVGRALDVVEALVLRYTNLLHPGAADEVDTAIYVAACAIGDRVSDSEHREAALLRLLIVRGVVRHWFLAKERRRATRAAQDYDTLSRVCTRYADDIILELTKVRVLAVRESG